MAEIADEFDVLASLPVPYEKVALSQAELDEAAADVDPEPTEAQKDVGNYRKGHVSWKGLNLTIESAVGQYRRGVTKAGVPWSTLMKDHYGYIKNTESEADGDHIDIFLCEDDLDSDVVFVVNQMEPTTGKFDEHKCILGATNKERADEIYHRNYQDGWTGCGEITPMTVDQFKWWIEWGDSSKPIADGMIAKHRRVKKADDDFDWDEYFAKRNGDSSHLIEAKFKPHTTYDPICPHCNEVMYEKHFVPDRNGPGWIHRGPCYDKGPFAINWPDREKDAHDLWEYDCPHCGGTAYNGNPETGDRFRGGGKCSECGETFSIVGLKLQPREKQADLLPDAKLRPHQQEVAEMGALPENRMLLYHSLGSGKSLSSLAAAETAGQPYTAVTPASLRPNYRKEQEKFTDHTVPNDLVSYNSVARGTVKPSPTLIFDEAQRLRNPDSLTTRNALELAREAKQLYMLSATPIVNHPHDLTPMIEMLTGKHFDPEEFDSKFIDERKISPGFFNWLRGVKPVKVPTMKNKPEFEKLMKGHVHSFTPEKPDVERRDEEIVTDMGPEQTKLYKAFWDQLPWLYRWKLQHSYPLTRQEMTRLSSFLSGPRQVGLSTYPFMRGKADALSAYEQSPKLQRAMTELQSTLQSDPESRGVVFSNFIDAGLTPYAAALERAGVPHGMFHGGLNDAARKKTVEDYNSGKSRVLLLGPSGGEGLSLKGTRLLQLLDPHWNEARSEQAVGRGLRYDSHMHLPIEDRNVRVQRYVSQLPPTKMQRLWRWMFGGEQNEDARRTAPGVDTYLQNLAHRKDDLNQQFLGELQRIGSKQAEYAPCLLGIKQAADEKSPFTIAVDLDGTLAEIMEPFDPKRIGVVRTGAVKWMKAFKAAGARLIIFTVRGDKEQVAAWLEENEIPYDFINENPDQPEGTSGKVIADVYWDDRAVNAKDLAGSARKVERLIKSAGDAYGVVDAYELLERLAV